MVQVIWLFLGSRQAPQAMRKHFPWQSQISRALSAVKPKFGLRRQVCSNHCIGLDYAVKLTETYLHAIFVGAEQIQVQASDLLADLLVFHLNAKHRLTHTFPPKFRLAQLDRGLDATDYSLSLLDLSCPRSNTSGVKANVVQTTVSFTTKLNTSSAHGQVIRLVYRLTKACAAMIYDMDDPACERQEWHEFGSIGRPIIGGRARICVDDVRPANICEVGNLELSSSVLFDGWYYDPISTAKASTEEGWSVMGNRAYTDTTGNLNLAGRAKEVSVINGVKYCPWQIEIALDRAAIPGVMPSYITAFRLRRQGDEKQDCCIAMAPFEAKMPRNVSLER